MAFINQIELSQDETFRKGCSSQKGHEWAGVIHF